MAWHETLPVLLIGGDPRDGVVRYARELAAGVRELTGLDRRAACPPSTGIVHLHFTDRLWGADPRQAAVRVEALARRLELSVTLHDVPQSSDGRSLVDRRDCYRRVIAAARIVVCNSEHEVSLLRSQDLGQDRRLTVVPLPVMPAAAASDAGLRREVALLGYIYPGKGHAEAIDAVARLDLRERPAVVALGCASAGHEDDLLSLTARAQSAGVRFAATGYLSESHLAARARAAAVPLAAHRHVSASGSIGSWIAVGRRPLVVDSPYARELQSLRPNTITRYAPTQLAQAICQALADPGATRLAASVSTRPHLADVAGAYLRRWAER